MIDVTKAQLTKAGHARIEAARHLCPKTGARRPSVAAYLAHVGLECLLKAWLLLKSKAEDTYELRRRLPQEEADEIFGGRSGHNLRLLAEKAALRRFLEAEGQQQLLDSAGWRRLAADRRPYDVRYGAVMVQVNHAKEEVGVAAQLGQLLEKVLR